MQIVDIIENHEKKLISHYKNIGSPKLGYTVVHTLKQKVDYHVAQSPSEDWNTVYLKELSETIADHGIKIQ